MFQHLLSNARDVFGQLIRPKRAKKEKKVAQGNRTATGAMMSQMNWRQPSIAALCCPSPKILQQMALSGEIIATCQNCGFSTIDFAPPTPKLDTAKIDALSGVEARKVQPKLVVPDLTTCIVGWRGWRVTEASSSLRLQGLGLDSVWTPKSIIQAECVANGSVFRRISASGEIIHPKPHDCPGKECSCGVWAFRTLEEFKKMAERYHNTLVVGQVYLWGRVLECENGYRAQYAYPKELWLLNSEHEELGAVYNVKIRSLGGK